MNRLASVLCTLLFASPAVAQVVEPDVLPFARPRGAAAPPPLITLQDALDRARRVDAGVQSAIADVEIAREGILQAKASRLPSLANTNQYAGTQGNGVTPNGRFVGADGVHVYRSVITVHQEFSPDTLLNTGYKKATASQALANAKVDIARRGLDFTVTDHYYAVVGAQRRYVTAQLGVQQAQRFLEITQQQETAGQTAHSDVVKAELQLQQQRRRFQEATLAIENARLNLAVLLSSTLDENFTVADDLDSASALPTFAELQTMAEKENPDLKAADAVVQQASVDVRGARNGFLPSLSVEGNYGIEANAFKLRSTVAAEPGLGPLPNPGYSVLLTLSVPIFDWGSTRSKVSQARVKERQAGIELNQVQRQIVGKLYASYNESVAARASVDLSRSSADLATESLRLINLRYQAGESSVLEVVDAQNTLIEARTAFDESRIRYRLAIATLQSVTGGF